MKDLSIYAVPMVPSKGQNPDIMKKQFVWRKTGVYDGNSEIVVALMEEPIWWNRPLESDSLCKLEPDGIYSYNLPFLWDRGLYKSGYNLLLNKNSVPVAAQIRINPNWTAAQLNLLHHFMINAAYDALLALGVDAKRLEKAHNDLLFDGKKFMGGEEIERGGWFTSDYIITMQYKPEKEIFDRLTGEFAQKRGITGIIEETNLFTKEEFTTKLLEKIKDIFDQLD